MAWGVTLWLDLWCVGIASCSFLAAFFLNKFGGNKQPNLFRLAVFTGIVFALTGVALLLSHLGHLWWFWHMFIIVRPESVLSLGGWILSLWLMVACIMAILWVAKFFIVKMKNEGNKDVLIELVDKLTGFWHGSAWCSPSFWSPTAAFLSLLPARTSGRTPYSSSLLSVGNVHRPGLAHHDFLRS